MKSKDSTIACDRMALDVDERRRYEALLSQLSQATEEIRELEDGYAFRYASDASIWLKAAEFVALERRCCPFFRFTLELEPQGGPVWLRLRGGEDVKEFLKTQLRTG